ncbi:hypothetical protein GGI35DRAFT_95054 [Trichoderma velutinum]
MYVCLTLHSVCQQTRGVPQGISRGRNRTSNTPCTHARTQRNRPWLGQVRPACYLPTPGRSRVERRKRLGRGKRARARKREKDWGPRDTLLRGALSKKGMISRHGCPALCNKEEESCDDKLSFLPSLPCRARFTPIIFGGKPCWFPGQGTGILIEARG